MAVGAVVVGVVAVVMPRSSPAGSSRKYDTELEAYELSRAPPKKRSIAAAHSSSAAVARPKERKEAVVEYDMIGLLNTGAVGDPNLEVAVPDGGQASELNMIAIGPDGGLVEAWPDEPKLLRRVNVRLGPSRAAGLLPVEVLRRVAREHLGRFRRCYQVGLEKEPKLAGKVTVYFTIRADGSVSDASAGESELADASVTACIVKVFSSIEFPKPGASSLGAELSLIFSPG